MFESNKSTATHCRYVVKSAVIYFKNMMFHFFQADTPGFYDPCPGVNKSLYIQYKFRNQLHETTIQDDEPIRLPLQSKSD